MPRSRFSGSYGNSLFVFFVLFCFVLFVCFCLKKTLFCFLGFPSGSAVKNLLKAGDVGLIPGSGSSPEEDMAAHSRILAWRMPWTEEPGGFIGVHRVRHDWRDFAQMHLVFHSGIPF